VPAAIPGEGALDHGEKMQNDEKPGDKTKHHLYDGRQQAHRQIQTSGYHLFRGIGINRGLYLLANVLSSGRRRSLTMRRLPIALQLRTFAARENVKDADT
jgi:hypothetical protein